MATTCPEHQLKSEETSWSPHCSERE
ncbi:rCG64413 [Rattus norvegicus]|uniref:RCG64413 n=1 Tax=Rattus norvegicus TaxID=10116 RepID=A6IEZ0_RAT|nr:rCG64413 [Rattus norvegicus]